MSHTFWKSQPVDKGSDKGTIENPSEVQSEPYKLPSDLTWHYESDVNKIVDFLKLFYVEDETSCFRLNYSADFFHYLFTCPTHKPEYSLCIKHKDKIIGYLLAKEHKLAINGEIKEIVSINFLCLHKENRNKRLATIMIQEITRIVYSFGIYHAIFTSQKDHGFSIARTTYFHLPLNYQRLIQLKYLDESHYFRNISYIKRKETRIALEEDYTEILRLYNEKYNKYKIYEVFGPLEIKFSVTNYKNVMTVLYNPETSEFVSYFTIDTYNIDEAASFRSAYLYYWSGDINILKDAIVQSKEDGHDLFNALDFGGNISSIKKLGFLEGTGELKYHLFNWREEDMKKPDINFILF